MSIAGLKRSIVGLLIVCGVGYAALAAAWNEPAGFRDIAWGVSEEWLRKKQDIHPSRCGPLAPDLGDRMCPDGFLIGGMPVTANFVFRADALVEVFLTFKSANFQMMEAIFIERYGKPTSVRQEVVTSAAGAQLTNKILEWTGTKAHVTLAQYSAKLTESIATLETASHRSDKVKRVLERTRQGARDL